MALIAEAVDIESAVAAERNAPAGMLEVRFYTPNPVAKETLQDIFDKVYASGADVKSVSTGKTDGLYYVAVRYRKPAVTASISALPVAIIPLVAFGMIALLVGIGIFKIETIANNIGKLLLITFGGTILLALALKKPLETYASKR